MPGFGLLLSLKQLNLSDSHAKLFNMPSGDNIDSILVALVSAEAAGISERVPLGLGKGVGCLAEGNSVCSRL